MTPYLLKEAFLAKTHNLKHLIRHTNAVGIYHCSLLCSHSQISVRTDGRTEGRTDKPSTVTLQRMRRGLGFVGFAIGFNEENTQVVGTSTTLKCFTPQIVEYNNNNNKYCKNGCFQFQHLSHFHKHTNF